MGFLRTVRSSIYDPEFYRTISTLPLRQAIWYFATLTLLLTLLSAPSTLLELAAVDKVISGVINDVKQNFPQDLVVSVMGGRVTTNAPQPYSYPLPADSEDGITALLVIDTTQPFSVARFREYRTLAWLTEDSLVASSDGALRTYGLDEFPDVVVNEASVARWTAAAATFVRPAMIALGVLSIPFFFLAYLFRLVYLFVLALPIWLLSRWSRVQLTYGQSYKVGLYALTAGLLFDLLLDLTSTWTNLTGFPFMMTVVSLVVVAVNLWMGRSLAASTPPHGAEGLPPAAGTDLRLPS